MDNRSTRPRVSIQRRALVLMLPPVIVFMLAIGLVSFIALNKQTAKLWEERTGGEYHRVAGEPFFQDALQLASGEVATSGKGPRRINATPVYWDEDGDGALTRTELRGVVVADFLYPVEQVSRERLVLAGMDTMLTDPVCFVIEVWLSMISLHERLTP